ncbi:MAG: alpha/beta hydrolase [Planctomycetes bacterium]|nr:alpha/beta hydrolase [Planctomycetota bacterium]
MVRSRRSRARRRRALPRARAAAAPRRRERARVRSPSRATWPTSPRSRAPRAALVGWSWGAMLALSYAALHRERASALVLVGCGTYSLASRTEYQRRMAARYGAAERAREEELRAALAAAERPRRARDALLGRWGALAEAAQAYALDDAAPRADDALAFDAAGHRETWDDALRLQAEGTEPARFAAIRCPVTLLHGADDPHPGALVRDDLLPCVPRLEYVELARCGHQPWRERHAADRFRAELLARLARAHGAE